MYEIACSRSGPPNVLAAVVACRTPLRVGNSNRRPSHLVRDLFGILGEWILAGSPELERQTDATHTVRFVHDALSVIILGSCSGFVVALRRRRCGGRIVLFPPARPQYHTREFLRRRARRKQISEALWVPAPRLELGGLGWVGIGWLSLLSSILRRVVQGCGIAGVTVHLRTPARQAVAGDDITVHKCGEHSA